MASSSAAVVSVSGAGLGSVVIYCRVSGEKHRMMPLAHPTYNKSTDADDDMHMSSMQNDEDDSSCTHFSTILDWLNCSNMPVELVQNTALSHEP